MSEEQSVFLYAPWRNEDNIKICQQNQPYWRLLKRDHLDGKLRELTPKTLGNLMWGCALTQTGTTKMFDEFSRQALIKLDNFACRDVGNFLWGMVGVRYQHHDLLKKMLSYCANRLHEFDADSIALSMWALSSIEGVDGVSDMVRRSFVPLSESVHSLSGSGCAKMWNVVGKLNLYHARFTENLDDRTEYWCHVLIPEEVANILLACSILRYEPQCMMSLVEQAFVILENMEKYGTNDEDDEDNNSSHHASRPSTTKSTRSNNNSKSRPSTKGSHRYNNSSRPNTAASSDLLLEESMRQDDINNNNNNNNGQKTLETAIEKQLNFDDNDNVNMTNNENKDEEEDAKKDPDILLPKNNAEFLRVLTNAFARFANGIRNAKSIKGPGKLLNKDREIMLARQCGYIVDKLTYAQSIDMTADFCALKIYQNLFFDNAWKVIEKTRSVADKQLKWLLTIDDVLANEASHCRGTPDFQSWLRQTIQSRGSVQVGKRATCLEQVTEMLYELGEKPDHTTRNVDIAILDKKIAINFLFDDSYIINGSKPLLGKVALKIRHYECLGWSSIGMSETQFNRIATLEKKKIFLNKELKLDDYKEDDEDGSNKSPLNSPQSNKKKKRKK